MTRSSTSPNGPWSSRATCCSTAAPRSRSWARSAAGSRCSRLCCARSAPGPWCPATARSAAPRSSTTSWPTCVSSSARRARPRRRDCLRCRPHGPLTWASSKIFLMPNGSWGIFTGPTSSWTGPSAAPRSTLPKPSATWSPTTAAVPSPATLSAGRAGEKKMAWLNEEVAALLREYAELTQITGGDVFRARNYEKAARSVRGWGEDISQLDVKGLRAIPGVGASIAAKIAEYLASGRIAALDELRAKIPAGVLELTRVPGLGPKRALQLNHDLGIQSVDELAAAVKAGRLEGLAGFGARSEERIASGIEVYRQGRERVLLDVALHTATAMVAALSAVPGCQRCAYAGSLRRWRETVGDVDILAAADDSAPLMAAFAAQPEVASVIASGPTKTSIRTSAGLQVDLRVVSPDAWGAALQYFTGSQAHNVAVRQIAIRQKLKLSEYGLFDVGEEGGRGGGRVIVSRT